MHNYSLGFKSCFEITFCYCSKNPSACLLYFVAGDILMATQVNNSGNILAAYDSSKMKPVLVYVLYLFYR